MIKDSKTGIERGDSSVIERNLTRDPKDSRLLIEQLQAWDGCWIGRSQRLCSWKNSEVDISVPPALHVLKHGQRMAGQLLKLGQGALSATKTGCGCARPRPPEP
jgi:hypothetical protein